MKNQITTFSVTAKLGLFFNPSPSQFEFLKKKYLILTNLETGPYLRGCPISNLSLIERLMRAHVRLTVRLT
jgi:hypothetical protein